MYVCTWFLSQFFLTPNSLKAQRRGVWFSSVSLGMPTQRTALLVHHVIVGGWLCITHQDSRLIETNVASVGPQIMSSLLSKTNKVSSRQELQISEAWDLTNDSKTNSRLHTCEYVLGLKMKILGKGGEEGVESDHGRLHF